MGCTCSKAEPNPTLLTRPQQKAGAKPSKSSEARCSQPQAAAATHTEQIPSTDPTAGRIDGPGDLGGVSLPAIAMPVLEIPEDHETLCGRCGWLCCNPGTTGRAARTTSSAAGATAAPAASLAWELQLLHVGRELQVKLKDPHFVAQRCDLDSSGDLDVHELKQATRAFGFKFSAPQLLKLMAGQPRISKECFAEIVVNEVEAEQVRPTVRPSIPHSLRGMALGQLQHLEELFINTGWLPAQCEAFNLEHADAIKKKKKFGQAANLYAMDSYVVTPMSRPGHCSARDQDALCTVPPASDKTSFSELVNAHGLIVHSFVSHFWGHLFSQTVTALQRWAEMSFQGIGQDSPKSVVFWICLFALNQHAVADEVGEDPKQGPFNAALAQAESGAVMVLDEEINPFKRIWCLFEVSRLKDLNRPFELICHLGSLSRPESLAASGADPAAVEAMMEATDTALGQVSAAKAQASFDDDKIRIWEEIADVGAKDMLLGTRPALQFWLKFDTEAATKTMMASCNGFDRHCRSLLSTAMLQFYLMYDRHAAAAKCCERGASFTKEQFAEIDARVPNLQRPTWLANVLMVAAGAGHEAVAKLLLDHGADVAAADNNGATALMFAARDGHEAVAKLLLDNGADVAAAYSDGGTALMDAAAAGHEAVAILLLDHGANVAALSNLGRSGLMVAVTGGHEAVAKLLLDHGADVAAADNDGATALMFASVGGHEAVVKLLLDHGADAADADNKGVTALIGAAFGGHEAVAKLLLDHGADVAAAAHDGNTALMVATEGGHEAIAELLLDRGASVAAAVWAVAKSLLFRTVRGAFVTTVGLRRSG